MFVNTDDKHDLFLVRLFLRKLPGEHEVGCSGKLRSPLYLEDPLQTLLFALQSQGTSNVSINQVCMLLHPLPHSLQYNVLQVTVDRVACGLLSKQLSPQAVCRHTRLSDSRALEASDTWGLG